MSRHATGGLRTWLVEVRIGGPLVLTDISCSPWRPGPRRPNAAHGVRFDFSGTGRPVQTAWTEIDALGNQFRCRAPIIGTGRAAPFAYDILFTAIPVAGPGGGAPGHFSTVPPLAVLVVTVGLLGAALVIPVIGYRRSRHPDLVPLPPQPAVQPYDQPYSQPYDPTRVD